MNKIAILEGLLFVVGDDGLTLDQMMDILEIKDTEAKELLGQLKEKYEKEDSGIRISFLGNTFKLTTKKEHREYYQRLIENEDSNVLSQAALETLATSFLTICALSTPRISFISCLVIGWL